MIILLVQKKRNGDVFFYEDNRVKSEISYLDKDLSFNDMDPNRHKFTWSIFYYILRQNKKPFFNSILE